MHIVRLSGRALLAATLVVLFFAPLTMVTSLLWVAGAVIFAKALFDLVRELRTTAGRSLVAIVIAVATLALFPAAALNLGAAFTGVDREAAALAKTVQATCAMSRRCPSHAQVCTVSGEGDVCRMGGSLGVRLPIRYSLVDDNKATDFRIRFSKGPDDTTTYKGGVYAPLARSTFVDGVEQP